MPRYHFHVYHDTNRTDFDGVELPDKNAAWEEATVAAGEMVKGLDGSLKPGHDWRMEVTDEFENPLWEIHVKAKKK
jgi:hypothetical protein